MSTLKKYLETNANNGEVHLLVQLSHEIMNFRKGFKGNLKNTFIGSHYLASCFGFDIVNEKAYLAIPESLFGIFANLRIRCIKANNDKSGIYILFESGKEKTNRICALKLNMRKSRVRSLLQYNTVTLVKLTKNGGIPVPSKTNSFSIKTFPMTKIDWE